MFCVHFSLLMFQIFFCRLRFLNNELDTKETKQALLRNKRDEKRAKLVNKPKHLSSHHFIEPNLEFNRCHEIRGSLRAMKPEGNLLADRFYSLQRRNIIPPSVKINKYVPVYLIFIICIKNACYCLSYVNRYFRYYH